MTNDDTKDVWNFHNGTKLPDGELNKIYPDLFQRGRRPNLFKEYQPELDRIELPELDEPEEVDTLVTLESSDKEDERFPYLENLARLLHYSAGITKRLTFGDQTIPLRAASCTGALYHIEIYVVCSRLPGLRAGIYHYDPRSNSLQQLRKGDYRQVIFDATGNYAVDDAPVTLVYTSSFWRNAFKYKSRAYRHVFWDGGTVLAQSLAMASLLNLHSKLLTGFVDDQISELLGIDNQEELPLALLTLGFSGMSTLREPPSTDLDPIPSKEQEWQKEFPAIVDFAKASSLTTVEEVQQFLKGSPTIPDSEGGKIQLKPQSTRKMETLPLEKLIPKRGSTREFSLFFIDNLKFSNLMKMGTSPILADYYKEFGQRLNQVYVAITAVEELPLGLHRFYPDSSRLELIKDGYFREELKEVGLNQDLAHDAAAVVFFIADLADLAKSYGNRAYRLAQLEASIFAGKMYLAAYAQDFGATGLTFQDDKAIDFIFGDGESAKDEKMLSFMLCIGHKKKKDE